MTTDQIKILTTIRKDLNEIKQRYATCEQTEQDGQTVATYRELWTAMEADPEINTNLYKIDVATGRLEALTRKTGTFRVQSYSTDRTRVAYT